MGLALSLPAYFTPFLGPVLGPVLGLCSCLSCCPACSPWAILHAWLGTSILTRATYAALFLAHSLLSIAFRSGYSLFATHVGPSDGAPRHVAAVHRAALALISLHALLAVLLTISRSRPQVHKAIQNTAFPFKFILYIGLLYVFVRPVIPISDQALLTLTNIVFKPAAVLFILLGLVLLIDGAHTLSEYALDRWHAQRLATSDSAYGTQSWKYILLGATGTIYILSLGLNIVLLVFFARGSCALNRTLILVNIALMLLVTFMAIHPIIQSHNPRSGLAQSSLVVFYATYLIASAVANYDPTPDYWQCNPLLNHGTARGTTIVLGTAFAFAAIAFSTTRAATESSLLAFPPQSIRLPTSTTPSSNPLTSRRGQYSEAHRRLQNELEMDEEERAYVMASTTASAQEGRESSGDADIRTQAVMDAIAAGSLPPSALAEHLARSGAHQKAFGQIDHRSQQTLNDEEDESFVGDDGYGREYNYVLFHCIFILATMYVAMLLTDWNDFTAGSGGEISIGRSSTAMWVRVISSWLAYAVYGWTLVAPILMPDSFVFS